MKSKSKMIEMLVAFCICTTCITLLEGFMGMLFAPEEMLSYQASFLPPIFGAISVFLGFVTWSDKELSIKQDLFRKVLHLILIEVVVFASNYIGGKFVSTLFNVVLLVSIAFIYVMVHVILWIDSQRSATLFNQKLKEYQIFFEKSVDK